MLKWLVKVKETEISSKIKEMLGGLLAAIPLVKGVQWQADSQAGSLRADLVADITLDAATGRDSIRLVMEIKTGLQPRMTHGAINQVKSIRNELVHLGGEAHPMIASDYISPRSAEILREARISYMDLTGTCWLSLPCIYVSHHGEQKRENERRDVKSLFGLKSSRMLRVMLNESAHPWQVKELAERTHLSLGQVSNIRRSLLEQDYAVAGTDLENKKGLKLTQPGAVLGDWKKVYKKKVDKGQGYYSWLKPEVRTEALKRAIVAAEKSGAKILLNGFSAARWFAPFVSPSAESFYADESGRELLKKYLELEAVAKGWNVYIEDPKDSFIYEQGITCAPGLRSTDIIQTYLDVADSGERGLEAAEHFEKYVLHELWQGSLKHNV